MIETRTIIIAAAVLLVALYAVGGHFAALYFYNKNMRRIETTKPDEFSLYLNYNDIDMVKYPRREFSFTSGQNKLVGFEYGGDNVRGLVIVAAGRGGTADDYMNFTIRLVDDGYRVLTYDKTGTARSEGNTLIGLYQPAIDLDALLTTIEAKSEYDDLPVYLLGHSMGGYGVCAVLEKTNRVKAAISLAGYNDGAELYTDQGLHMFGKKYYSLLPHFWFIQKRHFGSAMKMSAVHGINATDIPVLIIHGKTDEMVTCDTLSVYSHKDEITNQAVQYMLTEGSHEWLYSSKAAMTYHREMEKSLEAYLSRPDVKAQLDADSGSPAKLKAQWAQSVQLDKFLYNEIDEDVMSNIKNLFDAAG